MEGGYSTKWRHNKPILTYFYVTLAQILGYDSKQAKLIYDVRGQNIISFGEAPSCNGPSSL